MFTVSYPIWGIGLPRGMKGTLDNAGKEQLSEKERRSGATFVSDAVNRRVPIAENTEKRGGRRPTIRYDHSWGLFANSI